MGKLFLFIIIVFAVAAIATFGFKGQQSQSPEQPSQILTTAPRQSPKSKKVTSIFVPYWAMGKESINVSLYDRAIYFGVGVRGSDIDTSDPGYKTIRDFISEASTPKKLLTVRMLDTDRNLALLQNQESWSKLNANIIKAANDAGYTGVLLDLEMSAVPFQNTMDKMTSYTASFCGAAHEGKLTCSIAVYGDTFYRQRPYDVKAIADNSDEIMVMAYDFHKSRGEPGPNFPLSGKDKYGYDYAQMTTDFSVVPADKLTVVFGMYGYDWGVDENKKPLRQAKAMGDKDIQAQFIDTCETKNCTVIPDPISGETEIDYVDKNLLYHIVWYEDKSSAEKKADFLEKQGIGSVAYWTYGYF